MKIRILLACVLMLSLQGCVGTAINTVSDAAVSIIKVPFKVVGAVVDGVKGSDDEKEDNES